MNKVIEKKICLLDGTKIEININIPLGDYCIIDEKKDEFMTDILTNQILNGLRHSLDAYKNSELPNKFLHPQIFIVTNELPFYMLGAFHLVGDNIVVDADAISNIRRTSSDFLLGHEMGHKICKYKDYQDAYESIASSFGISVNGNEAFLSEMYANLCGLIVSKNDDEKLPHLDDYSLNETLSPMHTEHLKRQVLKSVYHI